MSEPEAAEARRGDGARLWAVAQALARAADAVRGGAPSRVPPLMLFTDPERTPRPWEIAARMPAGSGLVYRSFGAADADEVAARLRAVTRERGMTLLIGADPDLAGRAGADGLHLPERALGDTRTLRQRRPDWILTGAAHSVAAALEAEHLDAVVLSPIFPAGGASSARSPLGPRALSQASSGPNRIVALGGITRENAVSLTETGACALAAIDGIVRAFGP